MPFSNYSQLKNRIQRQSQRDDVGDYLEDAIYLAEKSIDQEGVTLRTNEERATTTMKTNDRFVPLPVGFNEMRSLRAYQGNRIFDLHYRTDESMTIHETPGRPFFYTINHQIEFDRIPNSEYKLEMKFYKIIDRLSDDNPSNDMLTAYPKLYLFGALHHLYDMLRDEEMAMYYEQKFLKTAAQAKVNERRGRYGPAPAMRSEGPTP